MNKIKVAIVGVGNCTSNLIQGLEYYKNNNMSKGLMKKYIGSYAVTDIEIVAAVDIAENKVHKDLSEAIFEFPNCTAKVCNVPKMGVIVKRGVTLDGLGNNLRNIVKESKDVPDDFEKILKDSGANVLVILLPSAAEEAALYYSKLALNLGVNVVNGIPVLLSRNEELVEMAKRNKACLIGDDFKSQIGGAILHRTLLGLLSLRGIEINKSYQINFAGNTDFLNLIERGKQKHESKKRSVSSTINHDINLAINVSYVENMDDNKTCIIYIEGTNFSGCPVRIETKLEVVDSANASGVIVDAIRYAMVSQEIGIYGYAKEASAFLMKSPLVQMDEKDAQFILDRKYK